jgi:hypothetical protein
MYNVLYCVSGRERAADSNIRNAVHDLFYTNACNEAAGQYLNAERVAHSKNQSARAVLGRCAMVYVQRSVHVHSANGTERSLPIYIQ